MANSCKGLSRKYCANRSRCQYVKKSRRYCRSLKNKSLKPKPKTLHKVIYILKTKTKSKLKPKPKPKQKTKPRLKTKQKSKGLFDDLFDSTTQKQRQKMRKSKTLKRKKSKGILSSFF